MDCFKSALLFALLLAGSGADKKIELQDIEEDNLKSEKQTDYEKPGYEHDNNAGPEQDLVPLEFLKSGFLRYFEKNQPQQQRYVHQYAVNEPVEKPPPAHYQSKPQFVPSGPSETQRTMVGYMSNMPMQIYLVPHYNDQQGPSMQPTAQYSPPTGMARVAPYHIPEASQPQTQYVEVPQYILPSGKAYVPPYGPAVPQITYVTYSSQPTAAAVSPHVTVATAAPPTPASILYQMPMVHYQSALVSPPIPTKGYYTGPQYVTDTNNVEENLENEVESPKHYNTQTEPPYSKPTPSEYTRYYNSRAPIREEYRQNAVSEIPPPNPLILRGHTSQIPKALPVFRPMSKPVYSGGATANAIPSSHGYTYPYRKRPNSLLDSYIPSNVQVEYLKHRGYGKDPLSAYEALSSARSLYPTQGHPRQLERGFLPNQMYHTAGGGVTYGHYKRMAKTEKPVHA